MSTELQDSSVVARGEGWLSAWVGDEHVMMSADTGTCISLSETGGRIWELMESPLALGTLYARLADEYDADPEIIRQDVAPFLQSMHEQRALTIQ